MQALARGLALFFGCFALSNGTAELLAGHAYGNGWWIACPCLPASLQSLFLFVAGLSLTAFGLWPRMAGWRRWLTGGLAVVLAAGACWNACAVWSLAQSGRIALGFPLPFSCLVAGALSLVGVAVFRNRAVPPDTREHCWCAGVALAAVLCFPLAQMFCYGRTDYRRPADAAVVLGARAYADGSPSQALHDRVQTAVELYREGLVSRLIMSGGPGDGAWHETEVMRKVALELGVPAHAIVLDPGGVNTRATASRTAKIFETLGARRVLVVSHGYHLPRVKLSYQQAGWQVCTVPARERYLLSGLPRFMAREVAAFWVYWAQGWN